MGKKTVVLVLSMLMAVGAASFSILGCGSDDPPPRQVIVPQPVTVVPVEDTSILALLPGKCFEFSSAAFLNTALAGVPVEVCYEGIGAPDQVRVTMTTDLGYAVGKKYLGSLFLQISTTNIPGLVPGTYLIEQQLLIGSDGEAVTTLVIAGGTPGQSGSTPFCEALNCVDTSLICDGEPVGECIVTGSAGG